MNQASDAYDFSTEFVKPNFNAISPSNIAVKMTITGNAPKVFCFLFQPIFTPCKGLILSFVFENKLCHSLEFLNTQNEYFVVMLVW